MKWKDLFNNDIQAYTRFEKYNWIYDKLTLIKGQEIACAPVGVYPSNYPVCVKPIINLYGMSRDANLIESSEEYEEFLYDENPSGQFWMPYIKGDQYSIDLLFNNGRIIFMDVFQGIPSENVFGLFEYYFHVNEYVLPKIIINFLELKMKKYTGPMNIEIINDIIIECHLRWNSDNYIWRRRTEFIKCIPLWLDQKKTIPLITEDVAYIPCFVDRNSDIEACQQTMEQCGNTRIKIYLDESEGEHQQNYVRLGMFVTQQDNINEIKLLKSKNNWI